MNTTLLGVEKRLQDRYQQLVQEHCGQAQPHASGPRILPAQTSPQAAAMAAWRFYLNPRTTFTRLAQPLLEAAADSAHRHCQDFALVPIDWSILDYRHHPSKADRAQVGNSKTLGYKLLSALLISDRNGQPLAPLCEQLQTAEGLLSSRFDRPRPLGSGLDELIPVFNFVTGLPLGKRPVFLIDAEADSVDHYRKWDRRGWRFVVRADAERYARLDGNDDEELRLAAIAERLHQQGAFAPVRTVDYHGQQAVQQVAEAAVVLDRPAYQNRVINGQRRRRRIVGRALPLRLIISELRDEQGQLLERWYLLSNVPAMVVAATIALWYYWRWAIETFWKLLKSAGQQLEHWQQDNGRFILKRLLVASMACVLAWRLGHSQAPQAEAARRVVMSLSGRQVEHGKKYTQEGLLAGVWVLLALEAVLQQTSVSHLKEMMDFVLGGSVEPAAAMSVPLRKTG
jgi:hypothetical protein